MVRGKKFREAFYQTYFSCRQEEPCNFSRKDTRTSHISMQTNESIILLMPRLKLPLIILMTWICLHFIHMYVHCQGILLNLKLVLNNSS